METLMNRLLIETEDYIHVEKFNDHAIVTVRSDMLEVITYFQEYIYEVLEHSGRSYEIDESFHIECKKDGLYGYIKINYNES